MVEIGLTDAKTALKRPSGAPKTSQRQPQNAPKAIFGSKNRANEARESSKTNLEALFGRSRGPKELPRTPKSPPRAPKRRPREPQNAFKIIFGSKMMIFQKSSSRPHKINIFEGRSPRHLSEIDSDRNSHNKKIHSCNH